MSDTNGTSKRLKVLAIVDYPDPKDERKTLTRWVKVGIGWANRDGSINLYMDAFPVGTNKLQIREEDPPGARRNGSATDLETVEVRP